LTRPSSRRAHLLDAPTFSTLPLAHPSAGPLDPLQISRDLHVDSSFIWIYNIYTRCLSVSLLFRAHSSFLSVIWRPLQNRFPIQLPPSPAGLIVCIHRTPHCLLFIRYEIQPIHSCPFRAHASQYNSLHRPLDLSFASIEPLTACYSFAMKYNLYTHVHFAPTPKPLPNTTPFIAHWTCRRILRYETQPIHLMLISRPPPNRFPTIANTTPSIARWTRRLRSYLYLSQLFRLEFYPMEFLLGHSQCNPTIVFVNLFEPVGVEECRG
jgi:hypothetical protein